MTTAGDRSILRKIPFLIVLATLSPFAYGKVIYVDDDATGANTSKHNRP